MKAMVKAEKKGDRQTVQAYANSLVLPDAQKWFQSVFGDDMGTQYAKASESSRAETVLSTPDTIAAMIAKKRTDVRSARLEDSCESDKTDIAYGLLLRHTQTEPVYDVQFSGSRDGVESQWAYFAYVSGGFRYISNPGVWDASLNADGGLAAPPMEMAKVRSGGSFREPQLLFAVVPEYPVIARKEGIQGPVIFRAIIWTDGTVHSLELVQGPCVLVETARTAIRRWKYAPALVEGKPVAVDTNIMYQFRLNY